MKRKIYDRLIKWKGSEDKKSLLILGARQVGKTYVVNEFAKTYDNYLYLNFETSPKAREIFNGELDVDDIISIMSLTFDNIKLEPGSTLLFFDEIQNCPNALVSLKPFTIDGRYDVIASGSLLGVNYKEVLSYPVGYVNIIHMRSMDFEEYLWAIGVSNAHIKKIRSCISEKKQINEAVLKVFNTHYRQYLLVGGMPEAIKVYLKTKNFQDVRAVHKTIIEMYISDVAKYAPTPEKSRAAECFRSIPEQLAKNNKKFRYSDVSQGSNSNARMYGGSLAWLRDAGLVEYCYNLQEPAMPLAMNVRRDSFKLYLHDTGLLLSMLDNAVSLAILNDDVYVNAGGIIENAVGEALAKNGIPLTYFDKQGKLEVDFILITGTEVTALEVKSGNNRQSKSLDSMMSDKYKVKRGIKLEKTNIYVDEKGVEHYPLFTASFIECLGALPD
jgi:predicted AAA+ superfamily ATPase